MRRLAQLVREQNIPIPTQFSPTQADINPEFMTEFDRWEKEREQSLPNPSTLGSKGLSLCHTALQICIDLSTELRYQDELRDLSGYLDTFSLLAEKIDEELRTVTEEGKLSNAIFLEMLFRQCMRLDEAIEKADSGALTVQDFSGHIITTDLSSAPNTIINLSHLAEVSMVPYLLLRGHITTEAAEKYIQPSSAPTSVGLFTPKPEIINGARKALRRQAEKLLPKQTSNHPFLDALDRESFNEALRKACRVGNIALIDLLYRYNIDANLKLDCDEKNSKGKSAHMLALEYNHDQAVLQLLCLQPQDQQEAAAPVTPGHK